MAQKRDLSIRLRKLLKERFSESDLRTVCFDLGFDYDDLPDSGKANKSREIVRYCEQRERLDDLMEVIRTSRPDISLEQAENQLTTSIPILALKMFRPDERTRLYQESLSFAISGQPYSWTRDFGLVLENNTPGSVAKNIRIRVSIGWAGGKQLQKAPLFQVPSIFRSWNADPQLLVNERPAIWNFKEAECVSFFGHPEEWPGFKLTLYEGWTGFFRLSYSISSADPFTQNRGELTLNVTYNPI